MMPERIRTVKEFTAASRERELVGITQAAYRVTEKCDRLQGPCGARCFSNHGEQQPDPTIEQINEVFDNLLNAGVNAVNIFGGEPLLRKDIVDILRLGRAKGFIMTLTTNCDFMSEELMAEIAPFIDYLSVSLDGESAKANDKYRGKGQFAAVKRVIDWYDPKMPFQLKVNTQVHKLNYDEIDDIPKLFGDKPVIWKLLQYTPREAGLQCKDTFAITCAEFEEKGRQIVEKNRVALDRNLYLYLRTYSYDEVPDVLIIRPQGDVLLNYQEGYVVIGNAHSGNIANMLVMTEDQHPGYFDANSREFNDSYPIFPT
ncbi:MAG: Radical SAM domain protein [Candidatus Beckwithbacteria bacterium GW2011_GWA2_43_10]|uniref:Radical SAM domain protein n=1 Tax=Candidatus Beckwithbacteria bacterium GW2011_GWA2_43_10 TaxID=1618369 RepID=A0A0G1C5I2_9BACT|nr:MAG: Radical SAM domain protein [Candidatus Beckwithbacteria bacterium GW2011_GWA2_43_10]